MKRPAAQTKEVISFGPFSLVASERLLTKDGVPVELSARAFDALVILLSRPNKVVSKNDLLAEVWPDVDRRRRQLAVPYRQPAQGVRRWQGRRPIHHNRIGARLLFRGPGFPVERPQR